jgi:putative hydrolase of the HAD superfamily
MANAYRAVIFDLGGVVFPSPLDAFDAYDTVAALPSGTVRSLIRVSSEEGAWAALERGSLTMDAFFDALELEAETSGFRLDARRLMASIASGFGPRPSMRRAVERIRAAGLHTAALTNNWIVADRERAPNGFAELGFDVVVESSIEGMRKPDPRIYQLVLERLGVAAEETVFLDDLGINLKPARALGMTTIKVTDPEVAIDELERTLGFDLRDATTSDTERERRD